MNPKDSKAGGVVDSLFSSAPVTVPDFPFLVRNHSARCIDRLFGDEAI
jgi:hypothetical protein